MRQALQWAGWAALGLIALVFVLAAWIGFQFYASRPQVSGVREVAALGREARIIRDAHGVPHIFAESEADAYFALGYAHAQDRFFQMDLTRRSVHGTLSELAGELTLDLDARARIRGTHTVAAALARGLPPALRALFQAYADGINVRLGEGAPAPEYALLFAHPAPWRVDDTAAAALAMTDNLIGGYEMEIARARLRERLTEAQLAAFYPAYPDWAARSIAADDLTAVQRGAASPQARTSADAARPGSNAWVLGGAHTATGAPILANDPHLGLASPGPFYLARITHGGEVLVGATLPGAPFVVIGRSADLAWTNTTNEIDAEDLIAAPAGGFDGVTSAAEEIRVRGLLGSRIVTIETRTARQGPILDPEYFPLDAFAGRDVALRSTALDPGNGLAGAVYAMNHARDVAAFIAAAEPWTAPTSNVIVAARDGAIGMVSTGRLPLRDAAGAWSGFVPWAAQPNIVNPRAGMIVTANNLITPNAYAFPMAGSFDPYRVSRITEMLTAGASRDVREAQAMQMDSSSIYARRLLPVLVAGAPPSSEAGREALAVLRAWDARMAPDRPEPLLFAAWMRALSRAIYADELGEENFRRAQGPRMNFLDSVLTGPNGAWCDDQSTDKTESCAALAGPALDRAIAELSEEMRGPMQSWRWGGRHVALFRHPLFTDLPLLDGIFTTRTPAGGDGGTINAAQYFYADGYTDVHGPGMRVVYDLADLDRSRYLVAPGQSGHPLSPHYRDLAPLWARGEGFEIATDWSPDAPPAGMRTLILQPRGD